MTDTSKTIGKLDEDEKLIRKLFVSGQMRKVWLINNPGRYTLMARSNKPEAKPFQRWVSHEVLPAIEKTGMYIAPAKTLAVEDLIIICGRHC